MDERIRPIYSELQGYLTQAPVDEGGKNIVYRNSGDPQTLVDQLNLTIDELNEITANNYDKLKIAPVRWGDGTAVHISDYRTKLNGLISKLHGQYFSKENAPFSMTPSTVISQQQLQSQTTNIQILLEVQSFLDKKTSLYSEGTKERGFLDRVKSTLSGVKDVNELIKLILEAGNSVGLSMAEILKIFH